MLVGNEGLQDGVASEESVAKTKKIEFLQPCQTKVILK